MKPTKPYWTIILLLAILKFILPFILTAPIYELQRDEYLYFQQGKHPALGYLENPPLLSYLGMISGWLGGTEFWIKFWPCLFGALTLIITCLIVAEFGGNRFAQFLAGLGVICGAFLRMHSLFQPNVLDVFFWTLAIYFLIRFVNTENKKFFYFFAVALALGFWSKHSILFLIASLVLSLLITYHRKILTKQFTYKAILLALVLMLPNVWWQWQHKWPLIHHMRELQETQLRFLNPVDFIKDQLLYLLPFVFVWISGLIWLFKRKTFRFLFLAYFIVIILLLIGRGKSYYSMGIYPVLLAAGSVAWESISVNRLWIRYALILFIILLTLPFIPILLAIWNPPKLAQFYKNYGVEKTGLLRWEDQKNHLLPQDFGDMLGWKELTAKAEKFFDSLPDSTKSNSVIYCRNYGQASSLQFYAKEKLFSSKVFSDNGSFLLWIPNNLTFKNLVFIGRKKPGHDDLVFQHFQNVRVIDSVTDIYSRQLGDKIIYFENIDSAGLRIARDILANKLTEFER
jgi:dolichyl-phosphate-mannose-protein mannosyltransferase